MVCKKFSITVVRIHFSNHEYLLQVCDQPKGKKEIIVECAVFLKYTSKASQLAYILYFLFFFNPKLLSLQLHNICHILQQECSTKVASVIRDMIYEITAKERKKKVRRLPKNQRIVSQNLKIQSLTHMMSFQCQICH